MAKSAMLSPCESTTDRIRDGSSAALTSRTGDLRREQ
jgi:hypothetical protein